MDPLEGQDNTEEIVEQQGVENPQEPVEQETGINPAWNPMLEVLPSSLHSLVTPHLTKWDQNFQSKIQEVHSQYEPYKNFLDEGVKPEQLQYALNVLQQIEENPAEVVKAIQAYMGEDEEQGLEDNVAEQQQTQSSDLPEWAQHPEFQKMQQMVNQMAQIMVQQREASTQAEQDAKFDADWKAAQEKYGQFDEDFVLSKLLNNENMTIDQAVESYVQWQQAKEAEIREKLRKPGPPVLDAGGSVPQATPNMAKLSGKDRTTLVAQMLAQAQQQANS